MTLWHLLSLDAPTVAAVWTWFIASANHIRVPGTVIFAMFLAVWVLYAADRLLDVRSLDGVANPEGAQLRDASGKHGNQIPPDIEERHLFHHRHRRAFRCAIAATSLGLSILIPKFPPDALHLYLVLAGALFGYFVLIHIHGNGRIPRDRVPKELAVGIFFSAATFIPTVARDFGHRLVLLPQAFLLATLLIVNCLFIYAWEHPGSSPRAHPATRVAVRHLPVLASMGVFVNLSVTVLALLASNQSSGRVLPWQLPLVCAAAFLLLLMCNACRNRLAPTTLRAAADLCLLTPVLLLPLLSF